MWRLTAAQDREVPTNYQHIVTWPLRTAGAGEKAEAAATTKVSEAEDPLAATKRENEESKAMETKNDIVAESDTAS